MFSSGYSQIWSSNISVFWLSNSLSVFPTQYIFAEFRGLLSPLILSFCSPGKSSFDTLTIFKERKSYIRSNLNLCLLPRHQMNRKKKLYAMKLQTWVFWESTFCENKGLKAHWESTYRKYICNIPNKNVYLLKSVRQNKHKRVWKRSFSYWRVWKLESNLF